MLSALLSAPITMGKHAGLYITVFLGLLAQSLISFFAQDALDTLLGFGTLDTSTLLQNIPTIGLAVLVLLVNLSISIFIFAAVANGIRTMDKKMPAPANVSFAHCVQLAIFLVIVLAAVFVLGAFFLALIQGTSGMIQFLLMLVLFVFFLGSFVVLIAFAFTPTLLGLGFEIKDALAQSWRITTKHVFGIVLFCIGLLLILGLLSTLTEIGVGGLTNEWIVLLVSVLLGSIGTFYAATAFMNALPMDVSPGSLPASRHLHKTK